MKPSTLKEIHILQEFYGETRTLTIPERFIRKSEITQNTNGDVILSIHIKFGYGTNKFFEFRKGIE